MLETSIRRFVPEDDPAYLREIEERRNRLHKLPFGHNTIKNYDTEFNQCQKDSRYWRSRLEGIENGSIPDSTADGRGECLKNLESIERMASFYFELCTEQLAQEFSVLITVLVSFIQNYSKEELNYIHSELGRMFSLPEIQAELSHFLNPKSGKLDLIRFKESLDKNLVSGELLSAVTRSHLESIKLQEDQLEQLTVSAKAEFKNAVAGGVKSGFLPQAALDNLHRIESVEVRLQDRFNDMFNPGIKGVNHGTGLITVVSTQLMANPSQLRHTLFHEFVHEISGKSISVIGRSQETTPSDTRQRVFEVIPRKIGVSLSTRNRLNEWINEAITEWVALQLSGYSDESEKAYGGSSFYPTERKELRRLFDSGLEEKLAKEAYFENFSSTRFEKPGQHYSKLVRRINEVERDTGAWNRLDASFSIDMLANELEKHNFCPCPKDISGFILSHPSYKWHKIKIKLLYGKKYEERELLFIENSDAMISKWQKAQENLHALKRAYGGRFEFEIEDAGKSATLSELSIT